jgi:hypothetical protein
MIPVDVDMNFFVWSVLHTYEELCFSCCFYILGPGEDIMSNPFIADLDMYRF